MIRSALVLCLAAVFGCDGPELKLCGEIPGDGCPIGRGGTCEDPYCAALYDCADGAWRQTEACPLNPVTSASAGSGGGSGGAGGCDAVVIDHSAEVPGCTPDLQEPDCPAVAAETCPSPCLTGCSDFFLCVARGWELVAFCTEDLEIVVVQP